VVDFKYFWTGFCRKSFGDGVGVSGWCRKAM